jgi:hypothetical protein
MIERKKKYLILFLLVIGIILLNGCIEESEITKEQSIEKFLDFKKKFDDKKLQGYDFSEAEKIGKEAYQAFNEGDYSKVNELLDKSFESLDKANTFSPHETTGPVSNLSKVKVAVVYERVTDREFLGGRDLDETIKILKDTQPDLIFRGFWIWSAPVPESPDNITTDIENLILERRTIKSENIPEFIRKTGFNYLELRESISAIKKEMPDVIFMGAIPAQMIGQVEINPVTGEKMAAEDTWEMALDPHKWGIEYHYNGKLLTKEEFQKLSSIGNQELNSEEEFDWKRAKGFYPDITKPEVQELILSWAKKQIDSGADAIWIDLLFSQAKILDSITNNSNHPAVRESYDSASKIIDDIHKYGDSKGKQIYVGTWSQPVTDYAINNSWPTPKLDFVTDSPSSKEIYYKKFDEDMWSSKRSHVKEVFGDIPSFVFIDWGGQPNAPIDVFSQKLNKEEQREWLKQADSFFQSQGMVFVYPVHGGDFWGNPAICSFGKYYVYDSLAPEFDTYETIKELTLLTKLKMG